jgi:SAM-dependent methyltransferase
MQTVSYDAVAANGWDFPADVWKGLTDFQRQFAMFEFAGDRTHTFYEERLKAIGFAGMNTAVDAACGMGQWSVVLSALNTRVWGVDLQTDRIEVARRLAAQMGRKNCEFQVGSVEALPYDDESVDGVFCYGAIMFTDMPRTLSEFHRVLRPGGRAYINANSYGWYAHMLVDRGLRGRDSRPVKAALTMIGNTVRGRTRQVVVGRSRFLGLVRRAGLRPLAVDLEGHISLVAGLKPRPAYRARHYGMDSIIELVAQKPLRATHPAGCSQQRNQ